MKFPHVGCLGREHTSAVNFIFADCTCRVAEFDSEVESASVLLISNQRMTTGLWSCSTCYNSRQRSGKQLHGFELQVMAKVHEIYLVL